MEILKNVAVPEELGDGQQGVDIHQSRSTNRMQLEEG